MNPEIPEQNKRADDEPSQSMADELIDGRTVGLPPNYADDTTDDPSAVEGEIQADEQKRGA